MPKPTDENNKPDKQHLTLTIGTPKGAFTAEFPKTTTVAELIQAAITAKQLGGGLDSFELFHDKTPLVPTNRPLVSFGLKDGDTLLLAATGTGV